MGNAETADGSDPAWNSHSQLDPRPALDPPAEEMRRVGYALVDEIVEHLTTLGSQRVARRGTRADFASLVDEPCPTASTSISDCMQFFFERVLPDMTRVNHPRFHGYIPCPSSYAGAIGQMLAAGTNPFVGSWLGGSTVSALELTVLRWIAELLEFRSDAAGIFTSGGSMANLVALASARERFGEDARNKGVIYVSSEGHASVNKAASILGFNPQAVRTIEVDTHYRMDVSSLEQAIRADREAGDLPFFVTANAGTTNTGSIDPLAEIAEVCRRLGVWFHVDAAYGGFAKLSSCVSERLAGMEQADSLTLDPHKWLYCPVGIGCVLVRDRLSMERAFSTTGSYLKDLPVDEVNFMDRGPELSRPARVLPVWMVLRSAGRTGLAEQIDRDIELARLAAELLSDDERLEVIPPDLSVVAFRHRRRPDQSEQQRSAQDDALMEATLESGELMLSTTLVGGLNTLRLVVMNHRTQEADVRRSVQQVLSHVG